MSVRMMLTVVLVWANLAGAQTAGENLVSNPGFERQLPQGGWVGIWNIRQELFNRGRIFVSPKYRKSGLNSLGLYPNAQNVVDSSFYDYGVIQRVPHANARAKSFLYGGWMNAEGDSVAILRMVAVGVDGSVFVRSIRMNPEPNRGSRQLHQRQDVFDVPDIALKELFLYCAVQGTEGSAYFDDLYVELAEANTKPLQPANAQSNVARIFVNPSHVIRRVPEGLYGMNIEYAHGFFGVWNEFTKKFDEEIIRLTKEAAPTSLRFPGGLFANFYHWRNGIGATRPVSLLLPDRGDSINTFGTDEAINFANEVKAPLFITANAYTGTPEEAVEWLRYLKEKGHPVKHWEIGNEIYFVNNPNDPEGEFWSPERYSATLNRFAQALKEEDPDVKIAADIEFNFGMNGCGQVGQSGCWTDVVLRNSKDHVDYLALHNALAPIMLGEDAGWDLRVVYEGMLAAPAVLRQMLDDLSQKVDQHMGPAGEKVRFAMVEYGPFFQIDPRNRFVDHVKTMASAVYTASLLKMFVEHPRMEIAQAFTLFDPWTQGWIGFRNSSERVAKAPFLAFELFRHNFGDLLVETQVESPTFNTRSIGVVPAASNVAYVEVVSSMDEKTGEMRIMAINKDLDRPMTAAFLLNGFTASGEVEMQTLEGTAPDANSGTTIPSFVPEGIFGPQSSFQPNGRFHEGGPEQIRLRPSSLKVNGSCFSVELPPHSVSAIKLRGYPIPPSSNPCPDPAEPYSNQGATASFSPAP